MREKRGLKKILDKRKIYIFSEGNTEICYFSQLKGNHDYNVSFEIPSTREGQLSRTDISKLKSKKLRIYEIIKGLRGNLSKLDIEKTNSKIFYLLDIDGADRESYSQSDIDFIKNHFEDENIKVIFSNRDIELWILLHFELYKKEDNKYIEKIQEITKKEYKKGNCNIRFFREIIQERLGNAIENGKFLETYNTNSKGRMNLNEMIPYTEIYKIFEEIIKQ